MNKSIYTRPKDLPDFSSPPLTEVVFGVQFQPASGYQQIYAGDVWKLFRENYPQVQEQGPIAPTFETFGLSSQLTAGQLNFVTGAMHDRFWFLSPGEGNELIQFQHDRLLHNWRKLGETSSEYPRFQYMLEKFSEELNLFEFFTKQSFSEALNINQCEITFINQIDVSDFTGSEAKNWLKFLNFDHISADDFSLTFRETVNGSHGKPQGRLIVEAASALDRKGNKIIRLSLTVRGAPNDSTIKSALEFLTIGHDLIVNRFSDITTSDAHQKWGKVS